MLLKINTRFETILIAIAGILMQPINTYTLDLRQKHLVIAKKILGRSEIKTYPINQLNLVPQNTRKPYSITIANKENAIITLQDFSNQTETLNLFNTLQQHIQ